MSQRKLLLADDSITIQKVVNLTFADEGIEVVTVSDGDAAIEKVSEFKPDLILADVNMPGLNGYQVCEKVKQTDEFQKTPVILLVGSFEPFDEAEAQRVGADDFLTKPFQSIRQLVSKVTELLDSEKGSAATAEETESATALKENSENSYESSASLDSGFRDDELDDEMIQTTQTSGFGLDEIGKFETKEPAQSMPSEDFPVREGDSFQSSASTREVIAETENFDYPADQKTAGTDFSEATSDGDELEAAKKEYKFSTVDFEDDFLELPAEKNENAAIEEKTFGELSPETAENSASNIFAEEDDAGNIPALGVAEPQSVDLTGQNQFNAASFGASTQLSSETIDIIVQKVVEKISDQVVREIAREVVPQMTDLIVRQMAEEKLNGS